MSLPKVAGDLNLPRIAGSIPIACLFIVVTEFAERFAYYGGTAPFQNYVENGPKEHHLDYSESPGALNKGPQTATFVNNLLIFIAYGSPLLGAFISDQYLGKFKTIAFFSIFYTIGFFLLTFTAIPSSYTDIGVPVYGDFAFSGLILSVVIIGTATGGIKALVSPMCADQVPQEDYIVEKNGQQYIVDPDLTIQSIYNWFYWAINVGALLGQFICTTVEKDSSFWKAFLLPSCMFVVAITIFVSGYKYYIHVPPEGSVYSKAISCVKYSLEVRKKMTASGEALTIPKETSFKYLEYAKIETPERKSKNWTASFPTELQQALKACSVFPLMSIYWVAYNQMVGNLISQAGQMVVPSWLSNDIINIFDPLMLIVFIPIFDFVVYPYLNRNNIEFGYVKRITVGMVLGGLSMVWAAGTQYYIYKDPAFVSENDDPDGNGVKSTIHVFWQLPAYFLIAISEIFASIGSLEYSYTHAPKSMKGIVSALSLLPNCVAALLGMLMAPLSTDPTYTLVYIITGAGTLISCVIFWISFKSFDVHDAILKREQLEAEKDDIQIIKEKGVQV
ncbi:POT family-domain-containing protein [Globomyces pollinis-pini]|nr:POT family-domain-containing protein [Globomyces pollinis-pini]